MKKIEEKDNSSEKFVSLLECIFECDNLEKVHSIHRSHQISLMKLYQIRFN